ncbi:hypothetical protein F4778DRAFT_775501 [Xylariomycetidae sp. FL2044]|nr:hypothetical protein F4778DRAFT_775501 [Xylariomycetidae sp. FL2044]
MRSATLLLLAASTCAGATWLRWTGDDAPAWVAQETGALTHEDLVGWNPKPTPAPGARPEKEVVLDLLRKRASGSSSGSPSSTDWENEQTCGWFSGTSSSPYTCGASQSCATNEDHVVGCVTGTFSPFFSVCLDYSAFQAGGCDSDVGSFTGCCQNSKNPACVTYIWTGEPARSMYRCATSTGIFSMLDVPQFVIDASLSSKTASRSTSTAPLPSDSTAMTTTGTTPGVVTNAPDTNDDPPAVSGDGGNGDSNNSSNLGPVIGGVVGGVALLILLLSLLAYYLIRKKLKFSWSSKKKKTTNKTSHKDDDSTYGHPPGPPPPMAYAGGNSNSRDQPSTSQPQPHYPAPVMAATNVGTSPGTATGLGGYSASPPPLSQGGPYNPGSTIVNTAPVYHQYQQQSPYHNGPAPATAPPVSYANDNSVNGQTGPPAYPFPSSSPAVVLVGLGVGAGEKDKHTPSSSPPPGGFYQPRDSSAMKSSPGQSQQEQQHQQQIQASYNHIGPPVAGPPLYQANGNSAVIGNKHVRFPSQSPSGIGAIAGVSAAAGGAFREKSPSPSSPPPGGFYKPRDSMMKSSSPDQAQQQQQQSQLIRDTNGPASLSPGSFISQNEQQQQREDQQQQQYQQQQQPQQYNQPWPPFLTLAYTNNSTIYDRATSITNTATTTTTNHNHTNTFTPSPATPQAQGTTTGISASNPPGYLSSQSTGVSSSTHLTNPTPLTISSSSANVSVAASNQAWWEYQQQQQQRAGAGIGAGTEEGRGGNHYMILAPTEHAPPPGHSLNPVEMPVNPAPPR